MAKDVRCLKHRSMFHKLRSVIVFLKLLLHLCYQDLLEYLFIIILFILLGLKKKKEIILFANTDIKQRILILVTKKEYIY